MLPGRLSLKQLYSKNSPHVSRDKVEGNIRSSFQRDHTLSALLFIKTLS